MTSTLTRLPHQCDGAVPTRAQINTAGVGSQFHYHADDGHGPSCTTHLRTVEGWRQIDVNGRRRPVASSAWVNDEHAAAPQPWSAYRWDLLVPAPEDPYAIGQTSSAELIANAPAGTCVGYTPVVGTNFTEPPNYYLIEDDETYFCHDGAIGGGAGRAGVSDNNWVFVANRWNLRRPAPTTAPVTPTAPVTAVVGSPAGLPLASREQVRLAAVGSQLRYTSTGGGSLVRLKTGDYDWFTVNERGTVATNGRHSTEDLLARMSTNIDEYTWDRLMLSKERAFAYPIGTRINITGDGCIRGTCDNPTEHAGPWEITDNYPTVHKINADGGRSSNGHYLNAFTDDRNTFEITRIGPAEEPTFGTVEWFTTAPVGTRLRCTYASQGDRCRAEKVSDDTGTWRQWTGENRGGAFDTTPEALARHNCDWELDPTLEPEPLVVDVTALDWTRLSSFEEAPAGTELACQLGAEGQHHAIKEGDGRWLFWMGVRTANTNLRYRTAADILRGHQTGWSLVTPPPAVVRGTVLTREVMDSAPDGTVAKYYANTTGDPLTRLANHEASNQTEVGGSQWRKINGRWHSFGGAFGYRAPLMLEDARTSAELRDGHYIVSAVCPVSGPVDTRQQLIDAPLGTEVSTGTAGETLNYRKYSTGWRIINADGTVDGHDWDNGAFPVPGQFQFVQRTAGLPESPAATVLPAIPFPVTREQMDTLPAGTVLQYDMGSTPARALERFQLGSSFDQFIKISEGTGLIHWARPFSHATPNAPMEEARYGDQVRRGSWIVVHIPTIPTTQAHPYYAVGSSAGYEHPDPETFATLPIGTVMRWSNTLYTKVNADEWHAEGSESVYEDDYWGSPGIITSLPGVTAAPEPAPEPDPVSDDPAAVQARVRECMAEVKAAVRSAQSGEGQDHVATGAWWLLGVDPLPAIDSTILFGSAFGLPVGSWVSGNGRVYEVTRNDAMYPDFRGGTGPNTMGLQSNVRVLSLGAFEAPVYLGRDDFLSQVWEKERELKERHSWCSKVEGRLENAGLDDPEKIGLPDSPPPPPLQVGDVVNTSTDARRLIALPAGSVMSFESRGTDRRHFMRMLGNGSEWVEFDGDHYETVSFGSMLVRVEFVSGYGA